MTKTLKKFFSNKINIILFVLGIVILFLVALYFSYAYFYYEEQDRLVDEHAIKTVNPDLLNIVGSEQLSIEEGNYFGTISPTVVYEGTDKPEYYDIYIELFTNTLIYTTKEKKPEVLLKVVDYKGNEITEIPGFYYKTVDEISGFDITEFYGKIPLVIDEPIKGDDAYYGRHTWTFTIYYVDLYSEQIINNGKEVIGDIIFEVNEDTEKLYDRILNDNGGEDNIKSFKHPNFKLATTSYDHYNSLVNDYTQADYVVENGLFYESKVDNYFYRGEATNNWVYFADAYWRILKIATNKSFKLIYSGTEAPTDRLGVNKDTDTSISIGKYNLTNNVVTNNMYSTSNIKTVLETWYNDNLSAYSKYLVNGWFCYQTGYTTSIVDDVTTYVFNAYSRLIVPSYYRAIGKPNLSCTVAGTSAKVGLMHADELIYAGIVPGIKTSNNFLATNEGFFSGTPAAFEDGVSKVFAVDANGEMVMSDVSDDLGIRPVIAIKSDVVVTGSGYYNEPYILE